MKSNVLYEQLHQQVRTDFFWPTTSNGYSNSVGAGYDREDVRDQITQESIDLGPSHWPGTAAPGGYGNVVIGGHRTLHTAPFHDDVHPGATSGDCSPRPWRSSNG